MHAWSNTTHIWAFILLHDFLINILEPIMTSMNNFYVWVKFCLCTSVHTFWTIVHCVYFKTLMNGTIINNTHCSLMPSYKSWTIVHLFYARLFIICLPFPHWLILAQPWASTPFSLMSLYSSCMVKCLLCMIVHHVVWKF